MRLSTAFAFALVALLVTSTLGAVAASPSLPTATADDRSSQQAPSFTTYQSDTDSPGAADPKQVIRINITETGDAEWTVESRILLTDDDEIDAFNEYSGERDGEYTTDDFESAKEHVEASTGREMSIEDAQRDEPRTEAPNDDEQEALEASDEFESDEAEIGVISYSFTWTNFGTVDGDHIYVDDVFQNDQGALLPALSSDQQLVINAPPNYEGLTSGGDDGTYVWDGPQALSDEPNLVFLASSGSSGFSLGWIGGGLIAFALVFGASGYLLAQRRSGLEWDSDRFPPVGLSGTGNQTAESTADSSRDSESIAASGASTAPGSTPPTGDRPGAPRDAELEFNEGTDIDLSLLSDEERVHRMLSENSGRMKQATIVKETGWSNAKVSQLLSKMDDNDEIEKLRIGRENLITHPEVDPTEID